METKFRRDGSNSGMLHGIMAIPCKREQGCKLHGKNFLDMFFEPDDNKMGSAKEVVPPIVCMKWFGNYVVIDSSSIKVTGAICVFEHCLCSACKHVHMSSQPATVF